MRRFHHQNKKPVNIGFNQHSRAKLTGGADKIRTCDPHNAIVVLYQLSYDPSQVPLSLSQRRGLSKSNHHRNPGEGL